MKVKYSRYTGEDMGIGAEDLLQALSDFLLESGFNSQYIPFSEWNQHTLEDLKKAIQQALEQGQLFDDERLQEMMQQLQNMTPEQMQKLVDNLVQKMVDEGQITVDQPQPDQPSSARHGQRAGQQGEVRGHRQVARLPGLQDAEGPARLAGQIQLRAARHARPGDGRRDLGVVAGCTNSATR